jgi:hypothetical protein
MAKTSLQTAQDRAKQNGIILEMRDDFVNYRKVARGTQGLKRCELDISNEQILCRRIDEMDDVYAEAFHKVIDELLGYPPVDVKNTSRQIEDLQRELAMYKDTVKTLAFQLEMAEAGGAGVMLKEDEVRRLALEQAAEHLMDHGAITTGSELVEVCEQIKKLQRSGVWK